MTTVERNPDVVEVVAETYTDEGQQIWWSAWQKADDDGRARMERIILSDPNC